ncbi:MAG: sugar kinase [Acidobacteria bacterium CG_4_9_14_3_um_filter_49_7]|nr:MAG: sugar kinase [Acidobacteria bacterium CG_4_9_14_3_um_filter_49_7]
MSIVAVGSVAYDSLKTPYGERERVLGGSATYFSIGASLFSHVNLVGVVGEDFEDDDLDLLKSRNVSLEGLVHRPGKTFFWKGEYGENLNEAITHDTQLNVFAEFNPEIPTSYLSSGIVFLGNIHPALQGKVIEQIGKGRFVALDTMNLWVKETRDELLKVLKGTNLLFVNEGEAKLLTGEPNTIRTGRKILEMGPEMVCIKRGEFGSILMDKENIAMVPAFPVEKVVDPTGAGDTFAAGFLGHVARTGKLDFPTCREAVKIGTVLSSLEIEDFSVERLKTITMEEIDRRLVEYRKIIS